MPSKLIEPSIQTPLISKKQGGHRHAELAAAVPEVTVVVALPASTCQSPTVRVGRCRRPQTARWNRCITVAGHPHHHHRCLNRQTHHLRLRSPATCTVRPHTRRFDRTRPVCCRACFPAATGALALSTSRTSPTAPSPHCAERRNRHRLLPSRTLETQNLRCQQRMQLPTHRRLRCRRAARRSQPLTPWWQPCQLHRWPCFRCSSCPQLSVP